MRLEVNGLSEILSRMQAYPTQTKRAIKTTMEAAMLVVWSKIPGYPVASPGSKYVRTGTLGRTLGVGTSGGQIGKPEIYEVKQDGGYTSGTIGTRLQYAPLVIGHSPTQQVRVHQGRWWTLSQTVFNSAKNGIKRTFEIMGEELAAWLDGKG